MRARIPLHLVHFILLLSQASAVDTTASAQSQASTTSTDASSQPPPSPSTSSSSIPGNGMTLWDVGFSLRDQWAELRDDEECPVHPDELITNITEPTESVATTSQSEPSPSTVEVEPEPAKPTDDTFVSFEEWKRIKMEEEEDEDEAEEETRVDNVSETASTSDSSSHPEKTGSITDRNSSEGSQNKSGDASSQRSAHSSQTPAASNKSKIILSSSGSTSQSVSQQQQPQQPSSSPPPPAHHNRYNYASPDCSARIHSSSPQTQHASSLLHKSRDRYMLTPCKAKEHWVVVELCDEIRIEAVEIAVWEFFSGVVREVRVSVGGEDDEDDEGGDVEVKGRSNKWTEVGAFVGKNVRGVQTFSLSQPTSFHRFIRLDFPSYFGTEYYCPVSQLKVYGMNQMEAFKWEQKRLSAGSKEKDRSGNREKEQEERRARERVEREKKEKEEKERQHQREKELDALEKLLHEQAGRAVPEILTETAILSSIEEVTNTASPEPTPSAITSNASDTINVTTIVSNESSSTNGGASSNVTTPAVRPSSSETPTAPPSSTYARSPPPRSDSSESIYAFIIRRLNALEGNSTLVARYIEEQAKVMRHMLTRVERGWDDWRADRESEDRSRWEQERMRQEDRLGKVISQLEQQRVAFEHERKAIQSQLRVLADELGYERRRGIAQLFILLVITVLGVVTRSSTIDAVLKPVLAEARRRRSIYGRKSISGPLTGLRIDMGHGRPPAVIGQDRPKSPEPYQDHLQSEAYDEIEKQRRGSASSPTPTPRVRTLSKPMSSTSSNRRPGTPNALRQRRQPSIVIPTFRSVSTTVIDRPYTPSSPSGGHPHSHHNATILVGSPRPRGSLPPSSTTSSSRPSGGPPRKLARSAHLHTMEIDKAKSHHNNNGSNAVKTVSLMIDPVFASHVQSTTKEDHEGIATPRKHSRFNDRRSSPAISVPLPRAGRAANETEVSPLTHDGQVEKVPEGLPIPTKTDTVKDRGVNGVETETETDDGQEGWGTEFETETEGEASASEVEEVMDGRRNVAGNTHDEEKEQKEEMIAELEKIWSHHPDEKSQLQ
ncbi:hypothetical protein CI109_101559 [Kwoniella shandongensis]|uniref:Uncharacterized protein n=1 Tax=Kwoniella shandongensis TaxID=1734106 RepID=A0A5M6CAN3_9TREE|nr:uncharacterized protein CI109_001309 [Kwoniella shandongensis]KAA5530505.1 hypothetical protein CI109_001309 [Kwoniella shandongensis]